MDTIYSGHYQEDFRPMFLVGNTYHASLDWPSINQVSGASVDLHFALWKEVAGILDNFLCGFSDLVVTVYCNGQRVDQQTLNWTQTISLGFDIYSHFTLTGTGPWFFRIKVDCGTDHYAFPASANIGIYPYTASGTGTGDSGSGDSGSGSGSGDSGSGAGSGGPDSGGAGSGDSGPDNGGGGNPPPDTGGNSDGGTPGWVWPVAITAVVLVGGYVYMQSKKPNYYVTTRSDNGR